MKRSLYSKVDHVSLPSWQAQIRGEKLWSLEPPPECYYQCQAMEIIVQPGDTSEYHRHYLITRENNL